MIWASPGGTSGNLPANTGDTRNLGSISVGKIPWRRAWQPTPVFLPGESHGQRSLVGCSLWGHEESDTTEQHGAVLGVEEEESATLSAHCLTLSHCSSLDSWPSSSIWRRPGPRRDSCLGTRSRGPRCAWCLTSSPAASSPCRCGSCVCGLPPFPRSCEPTLQHPALSAGRGRGQEDRGDPQGLGSRLWGRGRRGVKTPIPRGPNRIPRCPRFPRTTPEAPPPSQVGKGQEAGRGEPPRPCLHPEQPPFHLLCVIDWDSP